MNPFRRLSDGEQKRPSSNFTAAEFLGKIPNIKGITNSEEFLVYGESLRDEEVQQLGQFFGFLKNGINVTGSLIKRNDKGDRQYIFTNFLRGKATTGTKIILTPWMDEFVNSYVDGRITINFTLDELIEEARKG